MLKKPKRNLNSTLKNVPLDLMDEIRKYATKPSTFKIRWKYREPKKGKKYGYGGSLRREDAQSADMYVDLDSSKWIYEYIRANRQDYYEWRDNYDAQHQKHIEKYAQELKLKDNIIMGKLRKIEEMEEIRARDEGAYEELMDDVRIATQERDDSMHTIEKMEQEISVLKKWIVDLVQK